MKNLPNLNILILIENFILSNSKQSSLTNNHKFPIPTFPPFSTICHKIPSLNYFSQSFCREALQHTTWLFASICHEIIHHRTYFFVSLYEEAPLHYMCHSKCCCRTSFWQIKQNTSTFNGEHLYICKKVKAEEEVQDCFESWRSNTLTKVCKLRTTQSSCVHHMQAIWRCGPKGVGESKNACGACIAKMEQDHKTIAKVHLH